MKTMNQRHARLLELVKSDEISFVESVSAIYHWMRFEFAITDLHRASNKLEKHAIALDKIETMRNFRKELQEI